MAENLKDLAIHLKTEEGILCKLAVLSSYAIHMGVVVQSIVSLTSSLRGQLVKSFTTLLPNTLMFFIEKIRGAFALQKLITFFQENMLEFIRHECLKF